MTNPQSWLRGRTVVYNPTPKPPEPEKKKFSVLSIPKSILCFLWRAFKRTAMVIGFIVLLSVIFGIWTAAKSSKSVAPQLPDKMVLTFNLEGEVPETTGMTQILSLLQIEGAPVTLDDIVDALDRAGDDNHVKAIAFKVTSSGYNLTQLQVIREAVLRFRAKGKKAAIYSESYGESGYGLGLYYLASAFDEIWMQPVGVVAIGGIDMEMPFFKKVMDQYGIGAQFFQRKEYKNAMEHLTSERMSAASREETQSIVNDLASQLIEPIKQSRKQVSGTFDDLVNLGLLTDKKALQEGLIDKLNYEDVLLDAIRNKFDAKTIPVEDYVAFANRKKAESSLLSSNKSPKIAIIPVDGLIVSGSAKSSPYGMGDAMAGASDIVASIEEAANDKSVRVIVLRVNSPGGSPSASETIHRAIIWAKTVKKKSVIVSMGSLAASGGYWISAPADRIYALDSTLTGSIGVVGGKINLQDTWKKYNVNWESVKYGQNSGLMSLNTPFSESEQKQFEASLDGVYNTFIERVATGRHMSPEQVEKVAKGRAWTGRQALPLGLIDEIGGMDKVLDDIAKKQGVKSRNDLNLVYLPMTEDPFELMMQLLSQRVGLSPLFEKINAILAPALMLSEGRGARLVYDRKSIQ